jgi:hypothetical protein
MATLAYGGLAEQTVAKEAETFAVPEGMPFEEAGAFPTRDLPDLHEIVRGSLLAGLMKHSDERFRREFSGPLRPPGLSPPRERLCTLALPRVAWDQPVTQPFLHWKVARVSYVALRPTFLALPCSPGTPP